MATVHFVRRESVGEWYPRRIAAGQVKGEIDETYAVEVDDETLARWDAAEETARAAREAFDAAMAPVRAVRDEQAAACEAAEAAYYASLPERDPNDPVPPIRSLFPMAVSHPAHMVRLRFAGGEIDKTLAAGDSVTFEVGPINVTTD